MIGDRLMESNARQLLVNILAKRAKYNSDCMWCKEETYLTEPAYWSLYYLQNHGCCYIFYCDKCWKEYEEKHKPEMKEKQITLSEWLATH